MFKHILVPVDGSAAADAAVKAACALAGECGARLTFFHAKPTFFPGFISGEMILPDAGIEASCLAAMAERARSILDDASRVAKESGVACETRLGESDQPHVGIIEAAEAAGCDLIFMASHGRRGIGALLLGSETQKVLTHGDLPVLVYRQAS